MKYYILLIVSFLLFNLSIAQIGVKINLPEDFRGSEEYICKEVSFDKRYAIILNCNSDLGELHVFDFLTEKVVFKAFEIKEARFLGSEIVYLDFKNVLHTFKFSSGIERIIADSVLMFGILNNKLFYNQKDLLILPDNKIIQLQNCFEIFGNTNNVYCFSNEKSFRIDSSLKLFSVDVPKLDSNSTISILEDKWLLYTFGKKIILFDLLRNEVFRVIKKSRLNIQETLSFDDLILFDNDLYIKNWSGFSIVPLRNGNHQKIKEFEFQDHCYLAKNKLFLVEANRESKYIKIHDTYRDKIIVRIPDEAIDGQINGVESLNDSLFLLNFRWVNCMLLNVNSRIIYEVPIEPSLKVFGSINLMGLNRGNYFYVGGEGSYLYNVMKNEIRPVSLQIKNIKLMSFDGKHFNLYEFYSWAGPSSPNDLKTVYTLDPKTLSIIDTRMFDYGDTESQKFLDLYNKLPENNKFSVVERKALINLKDQQFEIAMDENQNILVSDGEYYFAPKLTVKHFRFFSEERLVSFEQLDPVYNRPDIILASIGEYFGGADQVLVANYRQSWEKRIDRLGLDKEKLGKGEIAVPSAEIIGADEIAYENKEGKVDIKVQANDSKYSLRRFNVYVNEVPLYGSMGISISQMNTHQLDTTLTVPLSYGENKIQVSVMNELGLENFKYPTYVNYIPVNNAVVAKTHYIGIGVNSFINKQYNLTYCVKDVNDLASALGGENTTVMILTDQQVTRENILQLKQYLKDSTTVNDKVIISCSSHGLLDDSLNFYLATHDVDFKHPELRGLRYEELESLLDGIPARQKLLLLDACNSGENDKTELLTNELAQKESKMNGSEVLAARGVIVQLEEENKNNFKKMNELFVNVRNNTGSVIISAAGGQESALEAIEIDGKKIENGAFTYSVLEYLKSKEGDKEALTVNKLKQYVENRVEELTEGKQKPTSRQETMEVDWRLR